MARNRPAPRSKRLYTELAYQPMLEVMLSSRPRLQDLHRHRRRPGLRAGVLRERLRRSARASDRHRRRDEVRVRQDGKPILTKLPKLLLNDNKAGKPEGIHLMIGRRPYAAFGNSTGDQQMLEWTAAGDGARLIMLLLHDDAEREYAYGPAQGLPDLRSAPSPLRSWPRRRATAGP